MRPGTFTVEPVHAGEYGPWWPLWRKDGKWWGYMGWFQTGELRPWSLLDLRHVLTIWFQVILPWKIARCFTRPGYRA